MNGIILFVAIVVVVAYILGFLQGATHVMSKSAQRQAKDEMEVLTQIAICYGLEPQPGETASEFRKRIVYRASTTDRPPCRREYVVGNGDE